MREIVSMAFRDEKDGRYMVLPLDNEYFIRSWDETMDGRIVSPSPELNPEEMIRAVKGRPITIEDKLGNQVETPRIIESWATSEIEPALV